MYLFLKDGRKCDRHGARRVGKERIQISEIGTITPFTCLNFHIINSLIGNFIHNNLFQVLLKEA